MLVKIVTDILFGQCTFSKSHQTTVLAADHRPAHLKRSETWTMRMQWVGTVPELGEVLTHYHHMFTKQTRYVDRSRWVWWRTWVMMIICLTKLSTGQFGYGGVPGCSVDPVCGYQILSSYFYVSQVSREIHIETMQPKQFEGWMEKGHQRIYIYIYFFTKTHIFCCCVCSSL